MALQLADNLSGHAHNENFFGLDGNDTIEGYYGDDRLTGGLGVDTLNDVSGNDTYVWTKGDGNDTIYDSNSGKTETDTLLLTNVASTDVKLTRTNGSSDGKLEIVSTGAIITLTNQFYAAGATTYGYGVERIQFSDGVVWTKTDISARMELRGTAANDTLTGNAHDENFIGLAGNDSIDGGYGNDRIEGGLGADAINGSFGMDTASYRNATQAVTINLALTTAQTGVAGAEQVGDIISNTENIEGSVFGDTLTGNLGNNIIWGGDGADVIDGAAGNDQILGGSGDDWFYSSTGQDTFDGGTGNDAIYYYTSALGVNINLATNIVSGGEAQGDTISNIEYVYGSNTGADTLVGSIGYNYLAGFGGNDTLSGGLDSDTLDGGLGADILDGGDGSDVAYYYRSVDGVSVNLATGIVSGGEAQGDTLISIESVYGSDTGGDTLVGNNQANTILGLGGNDSLTGAHGNDYLLGGAGVDTFVFQTGFGIDTLADFTAGAGVADIIQLSLGTSFDSFAEISAAATQVGADT